MSTRRTEAVMNPINVAFICGVHVVALGTLVSCVVRLPPLPTVVLACLLYWLSGLSITAGYHRLLAHRSYECTRAVAIFYLIFGAAAVQNSALRWASDHRRHHAHADNDNDPHDARRGFWWSHLGWVLHDGPVADYTNVRDLLSNRLIRWQARNYVPLAVVTCVLLPALIAGFWGDPIGGMLWAGAVRLVAQYHATFSVNSVAHRFGHRPYSLTTSARDNVLIALLTMGEGYHNFHHRFPSDYRSGARKSDYDPTKWLVCGLAFVGLAFNLRRTSTESIERARHRRRP
jgi:stearoyl-CoA desaturase (delta-9 desaturase)